MRAAPGDGQPNVSHASRTPNLIHKLLVGASNQPGTFLVYTSGVRVRLLTMSWYPICIRNSFHDTLLMATPPSEMDVFASHVHCSDATQEIPSPSTLGTAGRADPLFGQYVHGQSGHRQC